MSHPGSRMRSDCNVSLASPERDGPAKYWIPPNRASVVVRLIYCQQGNFGNFAFTSGRSNDDGMQYARMPRDEGVRGVN